MSNYGKHTHAANFGRFVEGCEACVVNRAAKEAKAPVAIQASSTTLNIVDSAYTHNGVPFSGYSQVVEDEGKSQVNTIATFTQPAPAPAPPPTVAPIAPVMTMDQVLEMIKALREPDDETKRKRDEEKLFKERRSAEMLELARTEIEQRQNRQNACSHTKDNGRTAIQGQIHSDNMYHGICVRCGYQPTPVHPAAGSMVGGLQ